MKIHLSCLQDHRLIVIFLTPFKKKLFDRKKEKPVTMVLDKKSL